MEAHLTDDPTTQLEHATSDELVRLIRKLRWVGMESDAEALQILLRSLEATDSVLAGPVDTD